MVAEIEAGWWIDIQNKFDAPIKLANERDWVPTAYNSDVPGITRDWLTHVSAERSVMRRWGVVVGDLGQIGGHGSKSLVHGVNFHAQRIDRFLLPYDRLVERGEGVFLKGGTYFQRFKSRGLIWVVVSHISGFRKAHVSARWYAAS